MAWWHGFKADETARRSVGFWTKEWRTEQVLRDHDALVDLLGKPKADVSIPAPKGRESRTLHLFLLHKGRF